MSKVDVYKLERLWRRWENMARGLEARADAERWEDTKRELRAVARTYRRAAAELQKQAATQTDPTSCAGEMPNESTPSTLTTD